MKLFRFIALSLVMIMMSACDPSGFNPEEIEDERVGDALSHEEIILGEKLEDPYSVNNIKKAMKALYPTKASRVDITPTDIYARFLPKSEEEYDRLVKMGLHLMDHPLDHRIIRDGDYYHDPSIAKESITWQYCVVKKDFVFPRDITYEILDYCFIAENELGSKAGDDFIDWDSVVRKSFELTGNSDLLVPSTKGSNKPSGRITIEDDMLPSVKPVGVSGVKVVCNVFVKFSSAYTDRDGYYTIPKSFSSKVRYRLMFQNSQGFCIGINKLIIPASTSALGKSSSSGLDVNITKNSDKKLFSRCAVNNAAFEYYSRCTEEDMNIPAPPQGLRIWIFQALNTSSAPMLKRGVGLDNAFIASFLGVYAILLEMFLPDVTIGVRDMEDYSSIYSVTCHELSHASHFTQAGRKYWYNYISYIVTEFMRNNGIAYGDGMSPTAGYCAVGEMWAYFMENLMYNERYGGVMPSNGMNYWFKPHIFRYLYERGMTRAQIFQALQSDVTDIDKLKDKLISLHPDKKDMIEVVFKRYSKK